MERLWLLIPFHFLLRPFSVSPVIAPPMFHSFSSLLFISSSVKFTKEVFPPYCPAKNYSQLQKLDGTKYTLGPHDLKSLRGRVPRVP